MKRLALIFATTLVAACNSSPSVDAKNATGEQVAAQLADAGGGPMLNPGHWETTVVTKDMKIPGMPPAIAAKVMQARAKPHTFAVCLTPEQAKKPKGEFFGAEAGCTYDHFTMGGGKIDAAMNCKKAGMNGSTKMAGAFSADSYQLAIDSSQTDEGGRTMSMKMEISSKRTGECTGKELSTR